MKKTMVMIISAILAISCAIGMTACSQGTKSAVGAEKNSAVVQKSALPSSSSYDASAKRQTVSLTNASADDDAYTYQQTYDDNDISYTYDDPDEIHVNYRSNSPIFRAMYDTIMNSGANSYYVCNIEGTGSEVLVLSFGEAEAERYYEVYELNGDYLTYLGQLGGSHTVPYIDDTTGTLCLYQAHMGSYAFGDIRADGELRVDYYGSGTVSADESYPDIPGTQVSFYDAADFSGIMMY